MVWQALFRLGQKVPGSEAGQPPIYCGAGPISKSNSFFNGAYFESYFESVSMVYVKLSFISVSLSIQQELNQTIDTFPPEGNQTMYWFFPSHSKL